MKSKLLHRRQTLKNHEEKFLIIQNKNKKQITIKIIKNKPDIKTKRKKNNKGLIKK